MGSRTAISAGVIAVALAAIPAALPPAAALASDCPKGGGLLGEVTGTLCDGVDKVTGTVDSVTGDTLSPVTDGVKETTGEVFGGVGEAAPTGGPVTGTRPGPSPSGTTLLPETIGEVCLPLLACGQETGGAPSASATPSPRPSEESGGSDRRRRDRETGSTPTGTATPGPAYPETEPHFTDAAPTGEPHGEEPAADPDDARIDLLWPNPLAKDLSLPLRDRDVVRPSGPASDLVGTLLTIVLLASAIAATRIVQQRRGRSERPDSIPFEPAPAGASRHRLA